MPKRKKFIGKNAATYRLIPCEMGSSQYDESAPKNILMPVSKNAKPLFPVPEPPIDASKPQSDSERLFPTKGPRPDWDADVVAALDEDFDFKDPENILEDDFISKANALTLDADAQNSDVDSICSDECDVSDVDSFNFSDDESSCQKGSHKKAPLSQYSMTSAISNCSESVKTFNEHFEKILETYDEDEIGALDCEEIEGHLADETHILEVLCNDKEEEQLKVGQYEDDLRNRILNYAETKPKENYVEVVLEKPTEFDCESILSTNSNLYNHPAVIKVNEIKKPLETKTKSTNRNLTAKSPELISYSEGEESDEESESDEECVRRSSAVCSIRPKDETPEQRRERKKMLKRAKREQRMLKKELKLTFKTEKKRLEKREINVQQNQGVKLM